jgi:hypothetical protein
MTLRLCKSAAAIIFLLAMGCQKVSPVTLDAAGVAPRVDYAPLAKVLKKSVNKDGAVVLLGFNHCKDCLDAQLKLLAVTGPTVTPKLFPTAEDALAYWYNARAAWAIKLASLCDDPDKAGADQIEQREFPLDGRTMTLEKIDEILAGDADWRVVAAAPGVRADRADLPNEPFSPKTVREQIPQRMDEFIDTPTRFVIDVDSQRIFVPPVIWQYRQRLIDEYQSRYHTQDAMFSTALLPYVHGSAMRRLQDAVGYACVEASPRTGVAVIKD